MTKKLDKIILIIGGSGYYGSSLARTLGLAIVLKTYYKNKIHDGIFFDLASSKISDVLIKYPNIKKIIILAGINSFSIINNNPEKSNFYNVTCTKKIIDEILKLNLVPIFISSESVFDGKRGNYIESDKTNPTFLYGFQKVNIEQYIINKFIRFQILRLSKIFDSDLKGNTLVVNWIKKLDLNENIFCANDNFFSPIHLNDASELCKRIINNNCNGIYHICSEKSINRKDMLNMVLNYYSKYKDYSGKIYYKSLKEFLGAEKQPLNTSMSLKKTISETKFRPKTFNEWVESTIKKRFLN